jgi:ADP-ribose pyrophosphatase
MTVPLHVKSRRDRPPQYPARFSVPDELVPWSVKFPGYAPPYFVDPSVLAQDKTRNPRGWAEPEDFSRIARPFQSHEGDISKDERGFPLNPRGRTGLRGRGLLGAWGANFAADPLVTRIGPETGTIEMLAIQRWDSGEWAIPGGMVDAGEEISRTLEREFLEEAGVSLDMSGAVEVYRGYADDRRNTDNAWMETVVKHLHLVPPLSLALQPVAGDDAKAVQWAALTFKLIHSLYASHGPFVRRALVLCLLSGEPEEIAERRGEVEALLSSSE